MKEREITPEEIAKVIKHGVKFENADRENSDKIIFSYYEFIIVVGIQDAAILEEDEESLARDISFSLVTAYRDINVLSSGITGEDFWNWRKLMLCICSQDDHNNSIINNRSQEGRIIVPYDSFLELFCKLQDTVYKDKEEQFKKMLNWTINATRPEKHYENTRRRTLLSIAVIRGYGSIVRLLLETGADPMISSFWRNFEFNSLTTLFRSNDGVDWVPPVVLEDMAMIIATHPNANQRMFEEINRSYPLLHRTLHRGAMRLVEHIIRERSYPNMFNITNKKQENAFILANNRGIDLRKFALIDGYIPEMTIKTFQEVPEDYSVLTLPPSISTVSFRLARVMNGERLVGGKAGKLRLIEGNSTDGYEFAIDHPDDINGPPDSMRWSVIQTPEEKQKISSIAESLNTSNPDPYHERYLQKNSIRPRRKKLEMGFMVPREHYLSNDFAWRFYYKTDLSQEFDPKKEFYEKKLPIDVIIGNNFGDSMSGVFVTINEYDNQSLMTSELIEDAAVFKLYPTW